MTQEKQQPKTGFLGSKYWRMILVLVTGLFVFGGSYVTYLFIHVFKRGLFFSMAAGFGVFAVGLFLVWYLIRSKIIT